MSRFPLPGHLFKRLLLAAFFALLVPCVHAQVNVTLKVERHLYLDYEPIVANVSITNMTGRDLTLADNAPDKWFSFEIINANGSPVPPIAADYHNDPITIPNGETVHRKVNLVNLYPVTDYGVYHVKASIYYAPMDKYFSSNEVPIEVSEGQNLWQQTVGIPEGQKNSGQYRTYSLVSFRQPKNLMLYARIVDDNAGIVYATYPLGPLINGYPPDAQVDENSQLNILEMSAPKEYLYTRLGPNGELLGQQDFTDLKTSPKLRRNAEGDVAIAGGIEVLPHTGPPAPSGPLLSSRPPGMPAAQ